MVKYFYLLITYTPNRSRREFANIGVILFRRDTATFEYLMSERTERLKAFFRDFDEREYRRLIEELKARLTRFQEPSWAREFRGTPRLQDLTAEAFLDPEDVLQGVYMGSGVTAQPNARLQELFAEFVRGAV